MLETNESRFLAFYERVIYNPSSWNVIDRFVKTLKIQEVFELFVDSEKVEELNTLLSAKLVEFKPILTSTRMYFSAMFLDKIIHKIYNAGFDNLDDTELIFKIQNSTIIKFVSIYESIMNQTCILANEYRAYIEQYQSLPNTTDEDIDYLTNVFTDAFPPMGIKYKMPSQEWLDANPHFLNAVNLCIYFADAYVCSVFANIQAKTPKTLVPNQIETKAVDCVEKQLIAHYIAECNKTIKQVNPEDLYLFVRNLKINNKQVLMALYYMYALQSIK